MKIYIPWLSSLLLIVIFSSCRNENVAPIRNVRFDPGLLNPAHAGGGVPCIFYNYYDSGHPKVLGNMYSGKILVAFQEGHTYEQAVATAASYGFVQGMGQVVQTHSSRLYPLNLVEGLSCKQVEQAIKVLEQDAHIAYAAPYFQTGNADAQLMGISNEFIVKLSDKQQAEVVLTRLASATRTAVVTSLNDETYVLRADKHSRGNALEMANFFQDQPHIKHAVPDFVIATD